MKPAAPVMRTCIWVVSDGRTTANCLVGEGKKATKDENSIFCRRRSFKRTWSVYLLSFARARPKGDPVSFLHPVFEKVIIINIWRSANKDKTSRGVNKPSAIELNNQRWDMQILTANKDIFYSWRPCSITSKNAVSRTELAARALRISRHSSTSPPPEQYPSSYPPPTTCSAAKNLHLDYPSNHDASKAS